MGLFAGGTKAETSLALLEHIRLAAPEIRKLWENSALRRQERDTRPKALLDFEHASR